MEIPRPREILAKQLAVWLSRTLPMRVDFSERMTPADVPREEVDQGGDDDCPSLVIVVDCREKVEIYADGCIRSSCHVPSSEFEDDDAADSQVELLLASISNSARPVFVFHCAYSQQRGPFCAQRFLSRCSTRDDLEKTPRVYVLKGGFLNWRNLARENELVSSLTEVPL